MTKIIAAIFLISISLFSQAQKLNENGAPFIRNYTPKEYGQELQNWATVQDNRGVMYFANNNGVLEFDGKNWKLITISNNSFVLSLAVDDNGTVYVGATGEFGYLASDETGMLKYISLTNYLSDADKKFVEIWKTFSTTNGVYFLARDKIFHWNNDTITTIPVLLHPQFGFAAFDKIFVVQNSGGISVLKDDKLQLLPFTEEFNPDLGRYVILPYKKNEILIVLDKGFYVYDLKALDNAVSYDENNPPFINI